VVDEPVHVGRLLPSWTHSAFYESDMAAQREELAGTEVDEKVQQKLMAELNDDLEALDDEIDGYLITDAAEVKLKTQVWEEMNREFLEAQAEKAAAREEEERAAIERGEIPGLYNGGRKKPLSKRQRRDAAASRVPGSAAEAAEAELRRNKKSSRINYDVVQILSRNLDDDAEHMPDGPGPVMSMQGDGGDEGDGWGSENDFDEGLSVHSEQTDAIDY